jgi:hypothetical protein
MKIVDIGVCIDNNDPKGLGRIRVVDYDDYIGGKSNIKDGIKHWSKDDPFVAAPFLPNNINFIPENKQAVKIIRYDTRKTTVNQEYIAGPFSTRYDFNSQEFQTQMSLTSYGVSVEDKVDIIKNEEGTLPENCKNALSKYKDYSVGGKYGSDALFTQDGLVLRGGKLIQKDVTSNQNRELLTKGFPIVSDKVAKLHLKKFGPKQFITEETKKESITENSNLKFIIEYDVDNLSNPNYVNFYLYNIKPNVTKKYNSSNFTESTQILAGESVFLYESGNTYTFRTDLNTITDYSGSTLTNKIKLIYQEIRNKLTQIQSNGFYQIVSVKILNDLVLGLGIFDEIYPFFYRPTSEFENRSVTATEQSDRLTLFNNIRLPGSTPKSSLVYSKDNVNPNTRTVDRTVKVLKTDTTSFEQTFGNITADKIYLLSTDTNFTDKKIDFPVLNTYEYEQSDYIEKIEPNTYSLVRGEVLLDFIDAVYNVLTTHVHNINKPYVKSDYDAHTKLDLLYNKLRDELINKSIKIN